MILDLLWLGLDQAFVTHTVEVFSGNMAVEVFEASEVAEAAEVNEAAEVSKAWKITTEDFRVVQVLEFIDLRTYIGLF